jgi:hypothetical protein
MSNGYLDKLRQNEWKSPAGNDFQLHFYSLPVVLPLCTAMLRFKYSI